MLVGHTKFSPDRHFGYFNMLFHHSSISTIGEIASVGERSTTAKQNVPQLIYTRLNWKIPPSVSGVRFFLNSFTPFQTSHPITISGFRQTCLVVPWVFVSTRTQKRYASTFLSLVYISLPSLKGQPHSHSRTRPYQTVVFVRECTNALQVKPCCWHIACPKPSLPKPVKNSAVKPSAPKPSSQHHPLQHQLQQIGKVQVQAVRMQIQVHC